MVRPTVHSGQYKSTCLYINNKTLEKLCFSAPFIWVFKTWWPIHKFRLKLLIYRVSKPPRFKVDMSFLKCFVTASL